MERPSRSPRPTSPLLASAAPTGRPRGPDPSRSPARDTREPGRRRGRPFPAQPLPITARRLRGTPRPRKLRRTRPGKPAPAAPRLRRDPQQPGAWNPVLRIATCPAREKERAGERGPGRRRGGGLRKHRPSAADSPAAGLFLQRHPNTAPSWSMKAPASRPGRPQPCRTGGRGGGGRGRLAPAAAAAATADLRLRGFTGWVPRGAACSKG